jgi:hypothetical protein
MIYFIFVKKNLSWFLFILQTKNPAVSLPGFNQIKKQLLEEGHFYRPGMATSFDGIEVDTSGEVRGIPNNRM